MAARRAAAGKGKDAGEGAPAKKASVRDPHPSDEHVRLVKALEAGLPRAVIARGEESWFRSLAVRRAVEAAERAGMEICRHDAEDPDYSAARLMDDLSTGALFGGARCVVLQNAEKVVVDRAQKASAAVREAFIARIAAGAEGLIVISASKLVANHALVTAAERHGGLVIGCRRLWDSPPPWNPDPRQAEPVQWLVRRAREVGVPLNPDQASYVYMATGNDLAALDAQLQRIAAAGDTAISEVVGYEAGASPFDVAEHMLAGRAVGAVFHLEALFQGGASQRDGSKVLDTAGIAVQLASALSAKLRESLAGSRARDAGVDISGAAAAAGVKGPPQAMQAFEARLAARDTATFARMLEQLAVVERRTRTSQGADVTDFAHLALAWRRDEDRRPAASPRPPPRGGWRQR